MTPIDFPSGACGAGCRAPTAQPARWQGGLAGHNGHVAGEVGTLLAGCTADGNDPSPEDEITQRYGEAVRYTLPEDPMPEGPDHDHAAVDQHRFLWNYDFSERDPLLQNAANVAGVHALDVQAGHLFAAVYGSHGASVDGGLVIWDLSDPATAHQGQGGSAQRTRPRVAKGRSPSAGGFMGLYTFVPTADHPVYGAAPKGTYLGTAGT